MTPKNFEVRKFPIGWAAHRVADRLLNRVADRLLKLKHPVDGVRERVWNQVWRSIRNEQACRM